MASTLASRTLKVDPTEAPIGFYAVSKESVATPSLGNICRACDWRPTCQKSETTDFTKKENRCMSYPVVLKDGSEVARSDGSSVVFKRIEEPV